MNCEKITISVNGYESADLYLYIMDHSVQTKPNRVRPLVLICPGGGYCMTSDREAEPVAVRYLAMGYHAAVLRYSVSPAKFPTALLQLGSAVIYLKQHALEYRIDPGKIILQGFSAGGHLACCLGVLWKEPWLHRHLGIEENMLKPAGMVLSYPVISSGIYGHKDSFINLMDHKKDWDGLSLENLVTKNTIPAFLWHTWDDEIVPVENSLLFFGALRKAGVPSELHIYTHGRHGLSLADTETADCEGEFVEEGCQSWIKLAEQWIRTL